MDFAAVIHRSALTDCYARSSREVEIRIRTGKDVTAVNLMQDDPYEYGISGDIHWIGRKTPMAVCRELKHCLIWSAVVRPEYYRLQYYFEIFSGEEKYLLLEDDFYTEESLARPGRWKQYFKFPWLNACDVITVPEWVADTVWYQIMPDRFCRGNPAPKRMKLKDWEDRETVDFNDFYGGDLRGVIEKLPYLKELGVNGIYLLPLFLSDTNHKYNTFDYKMLDSDFGTEEDMKELVEKAHSLGIRVMLDAVFNHSGTEFFAWKDVWEKGEDSAYFDWFCIHRTPFERKYADLHDGRFSGFAFLDNMPKLDTGNPKVAEYCIGCCRYWVERWGIDGIRFDVGNEISHDFLKKARRELKALKPDLFLLGEIWHDSVQWLQGDEYDSVMNYPFLESIHNFWVDPQATSRDMMYAVNRVYSLYSEQVNRVIFNFLDTHDTMRARNRCGSMDVLYQQLAMLMTLPGSPCIYYGTEIGMPGGHDPDCRRTMPWNQIGQGIWREETDQLRSLIALRKENGCIRDQDIRWYHDPDRSRLVCYERPGETGSILVMLNAGQTPIGICPEDEILFRWKLEGDILEPGGVVILRKASV